MTKWGRLPTCGRLPIGLFRSRQVRKAGTTALQVVRKQGERGLTLVELIVAFTILALLTSMAVPLARYKVRRDKERELRSALREIHKAIDDYKDAALAGKFQVKLGTEGYPETLEQLVEGVKLSGSADGKKVKFLRRIPIDPMTGRREWGIRSM